jgi:hypothetical protein
MKLQIKRWLLGFAMLFLFAGVYTPPQAQAKVAVVIGVGVHHRRHYRRHHHYYHH